MTRLLGAIALMCVLAVAAIAGEPVSQTFGAPPEKVWSVTQSVLKQQGWDIEKQDQANGWINTESRSVNGEDYGVYAKGARHRLVIRFKPAGRTARRSAWSEACSTASGSCGSTRTSR